ncbi:MAG: sulfatase-like hydrolase/transferase [Rhodospirillales bacterium]|nr:sulfatase-like hydrolase/transferase [Rhodospirillales bacterium]
MARRPNILWYCTDQQRWDTIAALGNPHINTPNIDSLCGAGTAFNNAFTQCPICTPSRATMLTGRYPVAHQVHRNGNRRFPAHEVLVTKMLADAGYDCGLAGKLHLSAAGKMEERVDDGYRVFHWSHHPTPDYPKGHAYDDWLRDEKGVDPIELFDGLGGFCGAGVPAELHQTTWCSEMAIRFIEEKRDADQPWLFSANPFDPHPPFDPPQEYLDRYDPAALPPPLFRDSDIERQKAFRGIDQQAVEAINPNKPLREGGSGEASRESLAYTAPDDFDGRQVKAAYYGMIELIDREFGRIVDALRDSGQLDNTIILFHSDHGELLGDHGLIYKGCRFFEGLVHVPLIAAWPGRIGEGVVSDALVELVDLAPTLLDAAGMDIPENMQGKSLRPLLCGEADPGYHKDHVISQFYDALAQPDGSHGTMYRDQRYKMAVYHGHNVGELYDLENDPGEFDNMWDDPASRDLKCEILHRHLDAMMGTVPPGEPRIDRY